MKPTPDTHSSRREHQGWQLHWPFLQKFDLYVPSPSSAFLPATSPSHQSNHHRHDSILSTISQGCTEGKQSSGRGKC